MISIDKIRVCIAILLFVACGVSEAAYAIESCMPDIEKQNIMNEIQAGDAHGMEGFHKAPQCFSWPLLYIAAKRLFIDGQKDEAIRWFYVGQLRGRVNAEFDPDKSGSDALLASLNETVGRPINEYAGADLSKWIADIDWVLTWDQAHPLSLEDAQLLLEKRAVIDPDKYSQSYKEVRAGLQSLRDKLVKQDPAEWKRQRKENGLQ